ncbi:MAG: response regulator transcription factor [Deltaproteobacteria bacterium]|nr:response regulator transcription factor [Deltaproteobacteria bacterium]
MNRKAKILVVEDEEAIRAGLVDVLVYHGYEVEFSADGAEALEMARKEKYDLILLDVMLPSLDGFSVCNAIRETDRVQPIVMLTARTSEEDIIEGLTLGADDYIAKPFSVRELVLRLEAVLRRSGKLKASTQKLRVGESLEIDVANLLGVHMAGAEQGKVVDEIVFTRREVEILQYLQENSSRPVSRHELLQEVWGYSKASQIETRTVDIHIAKLRRKIEVDPKNPHCLVTVRGEGYKLLSGVERSGKCEG